MHHARHVERDLGEQKIPHDVLQPHDQPEQDLGDEQDDGGDEIGFRNSL